MNELQVYEGGVVDIAVSRPPEVVIEEARKAAKVLTDVLKAKPNKVMMNGEQYLEFEDWQTVARFYGATAKVKETEFINYGGVNGFLAKAVVVRADGAEISAAEAMCMNDEEKWSNRTKYAYAYVLADGSKSEEEPTKDQIVWVDNPKKPGKKMPKRERVAVGEVAVPLFQLRSMAQTRACAKALRNVFAWVVVLAGYKAVVAEELTGDEDFPEDKKPPIKKPEKLTKKADAKTDKATEQATINVASLAYKDGEKADGTPYRLYTIIDDAGEKYGTFSETFADLATTAQREGTPVNISYSVGKFGKGIVSLEIAA